MPQESSPGLGTIDRLGGRLCLDFVNTANWSGEQVVDEDLTDPQALALWAERLGLIAAAELEGDFAEVLPARAALRRLFTDRERRTEDLALLDSLRSRPARLTAGPGGRLRLEQPGIEGLLALIAQSAADLLLSPAVERVKICPGDRCNWLFLDESPSGRRRWCSMAVCGNRAKAKRHYAQQRKKG